VGVVHAIFLAGGLSRNVTPLQYLLTSARGWHFRKLGPRQHTFVLGCVCACSSRGGRWDFWREWGELTPFQYFGTAVLFVWHF
jgi:hypothetical protein